MVGIKFEPREFKHFAGGQHYVLQKEMIVISHAGPPPGRAGAGDTSYSGPPLGAFFAQPLKIPLHFPLHSLPFLHSPPTSILPPPCPHTTPFSHNSSLLMPISCASTWLILRFLAFNWVPTQSNISAAPKNSYAPWQNQCALRICTPVSPIEMASGQT